MTTNVSAVPRIGVPARRSSLECGPSHPYVEEELKVFNAVLDLIRASGAEPVVIEPANQAELAGAFASCQGFVLPGGGDIDPGLYGGPSDEPTLFGVDAEQDRIDIAAIRFGVDNSLPVLGICRGMQLLNVVYGGTLHVDLAPGSVPHVDELPEGKRDFAVHDVQLEPGTRVSAAFNDAERIAIASYHHQAIDALGTGLRITGRADDGHIEAIEADGENWVLGVQWHPEAEIPVAGLRLPAFTALRAEAQRAGRRSNNPAPNLQET